jgi:hypothetical protein
MGGPDPGTDHPKAIPGESWAYEVRGNTSTLQFGPEMRVAASWKHHPPFTATLCVGG